MGKHSSFLYKNLRKFAQASLATVLLSGCLKESSDSSSEAQNTFQGCVSGEAINANSVRIQFEFPQSMSRIVIYRNGSPVFNSSNRATTTFTDMGLLEAATYTYSCEGIEEGIQKLGSRTVEVTTLSSNPPNFAGVQSITALGPRSLRVNWGATSGGGPVISTYQVFANPGPTVNWSLAPRATLTEGNFSTTLNALGDELQYAVGVRACTSFGICDTNTVQRTLTLADGGAPQTTGISSLSAANSEVTITMPWQESQGAVARRLIYMKVGGGPSTNLADYTLVRTIVVANTAAPAQTAVITGISDMSTFHFIAQDEDPAGNNNNNLIVQTINTGDLTPPSFGGITSLVQGSPSESSLVASFTAIADAANYIVLRTQASYPTTPANPCTSGSIVDTLTAASYPPGDRTYTMTGLSPRTNYSICIKAQDAAGNTSLTSAFITINTEDTTAPVFSGIQNLIFNPVDSKIYVEWNPSSSPDILRYKVRLWRNTPTPAPADISELVYLHSLFPSSVAFTRPTPFLFNNLDTVYAVVDACDDWLAGNCTSNPLSSARVVSLPEFIPPQGFTGIQPASFHSSTVEGQIQIFWKPPTAWTADFAGFRVYTTDTMGNLTLRRTCPCVTPGACNSVTDLSCTVTGVPNPGRTYRWHVRAYNNSGFEAVLDPTNPAFYAEKKMADTTAPNFFSGLSVSPTFYLTWSAATDNQFNEPSNSMSYLIYRRASSTFPTPTNPSSGGTLIDIVVNTTSYQDSGLSAGVTYFYAICARDSSGNTTCDGTVQSRTAADTTPPVIGFFNSTKTPTLKRWDLNWSMSDTGTATPNLQVLIQRKITTTSSVPTNWSEGNEVTLLSTTGATTLTNLTGPLNQDRYVHYRLTVTDDNGNQNTAITTVHSTNQITITNVSKAYGTTSGGKTVVIEGTGFSKGSDNGFGTSTIAKMGKPTTSNCATTNVVTDKILICHTAPGAPGFVNIEIVNPDGSSLTYNDGYEYRSSSSDVCDNPGTWGTEMAAGTGTVGDPFIICTQAQFNRLRWNVSDGMAVNYRTGGFHFRLGDHIDLSGGFAPIPDQSNGGLNLDGDNYALLGFSLTDSSTQHKGLFRGGSNITLRLKNLKVLNFNVASTSSETCNGLLVGWYSGIVSFDNLFVLGSVSGDGGGVGIGGAGGLVGCGNPAVSDVSVQVQITQPPGYGCLGGFVGRVTGSSSYERVRLLEGSILSGGSMIGGLFGYSQVSASLVVTKAKIEGQIGSETSASGVGGVAGGLHKTSSLGVVQIREVEMAATLRSSSSVVGLSGLVGFFQVFNEGVTLEDNIVRGAIFSDSGQPKFAFGLLDYGGATIPGSVLNRNISVMPILNSWGGHEKSCGFWLKYGSSTFSGGHNYYDSVNCNLTYHPRFIADGLTTTQLQDQANPMWSGFDFTPGTGKWKWCAGSGVYPQLAWLPCP